MTATETDQYGTHRRRQWKSLRTGDRIDTNVGPGTITNIEREPTAAIMGMGAQSDLVVTVRVADGRERSVLVRPTQTINAYTS